jgi:hypothetical protein
MSQRAFGILCGGYRFELSYHRIYGPIGSAGISRSRVLTVVVGSAPLISNSDTRLISGTAKYWLIQPLNGVLYMSEYEGMIYLFNMTVAEFRFTPLYDPK